MSIVHPDQAVELAPGVHWIGALDPHLRRFDIILSTANGTSYNAYLVRGEQGVAVIDTVKEAFADDFFRRLESVARYDEITTIVLNHLEPDHSGALPELLRRAPNARVYLSSRAQMMLKALLKPSSNQAPPDYTPVTTGDTIDLGGRTLADYLTVTDMVFDVAALLLPGHDNVIAIHGTDHPLGGNVWAAYTLQINGGTP